jgi:hypothetical protein
MGVNMVWGTMSASADMGGTYIFKKMGYLSVKSLLSGSCGEEI